MTTGLRHGTRFQCLDAILHAFATHASVNLHAHVVTQCGANLQASKEQGHAAHRISHPWRSAPPALAWVTGGQPGWHHVGRFAVAGLTCVLILKTNVGYLSRNKGRLGKAALPPLLAISISISRRSTSHLWLCDQDIQALQRSQAKHRCFS